jgi:hypothetical protein
MRNMHFMHRQPPRFHWMVRSLAALVMAGAILLASRGRAAAETPATAPPPALEAGDTAPPAGAPPPTHVEPLEPSPPPSTLTAPTPDAFSAPLVVPPPPAPRHEPIYRKDWFWGAVGVVLLTGAIIFVLAVSSGDPTTPNTKLGDMRAF